MKCAKHFTRLLVIRFSISFYLSFFLFFFFYNKHDCIIFACFLDIFFDPKLNKSESNCWRWLRADVDKILLTFILNHKFYIYFFRFKSKVTNSRLVYTVIKTIYTIHIWFKKLVYNTRSQKKFRLENPLRTALYLHKKRCTFMLYLTD